MNTTMHSMNNDLLLVSFFMNENGWVGANKSNFQRVLYFAAVLFPLVESQSEWSYSFSNTLFGPYNNEISTQLAALQTRGLLNLENRNVYANRIEEKYVISPKGINVCQTILFEMLPLRQRVTWLKTVVTSLSIYGEAFLTKLVKEDPNIFYQNKINKKGKISLKARDNLSFEFLEHIRQLGRDGGTFDLSKDEDYLLVYFDVLYRQYKGGNQK